MRTGYTSSQFPPYQDVKSTAKLYEKALEKYKIFDVDKEPNTLYSLASIGKAYLKLWDKINRGTDLTFLRHWGLISLPSHGMKGNSCQGNPKLCPDRFSWVLIHP